MNGTTNRNLAAVLLTGVLATGAASAATRPAGRALLPAKDGTFLVQETGSRPGAFRFAHVTAEGALLDRLAIATPEGHPVAGSLEVDRGAWFRHLDPQSGAVTLRLVREDGSVVRTHRIAPPTLPDGRPDGRVLVDVSPSGLFALARTVPTAAPSQLEWWNLVDGARHPVLTPHSSYQPELRRDALAAAQLHPGWLQRFLLSAPKERFSDVLAELSSGCSASLPWALRGGDQVLAAHPLDDGLALFLVERPDRPVAESGSPIVHAAPRQGATAPTAGRTFLVLTYDQAGHELRSAEVGRVDASGGTDLAQRDLSFSRDGLRLLATAGDGRIDTIDLVDGKRDRFSVVTPLRDEAWEDAQQRGTGPVLAYDSGVDALD